MDIPLALLLVFLAGCSLTEHPRWKGFNEVAARAACVKKVMNSTEPCTIKLQVEACMYRTLKEMEGQ